MIIFIKFTFFPCRIGQSNPFMKHIKKGNKEEENKSKERKKRKENKISHLNHNCIVIKE